MPKQQINSRSKIFVDTAFVQALLNPRDQYHNKALELAPMLDAAEKIWTTEFVLIEIANALSAINRKGALSFIESFSSQTDKIIVVAASRPLYRRGLGVYRQYEDKEWGLTDCISFVVMWDNNLTEALATDQHFVQAGFRALMRDD